MKVLLLALAISAACAFTVRYDGHQVLRVVPEDRVQLDTLRKLEDIPHATADWDFWKSPGAINKIVDIRVAPAHSQLVKDVIASAGLNYTVQIEDLQVYFEQARAPVGDTWDTAYHDLADINNWITGLANANPSFVTLINIGKSYEGKDILGLKISKATTNVPQIYIDGGIHAREWMAPATVQYLIGQFVNHASTYDSYLKSFEWYFIPVFNPDGYDYTWTTDPNWRKNRQPNSNAACVGTDNCRNADAGFGGEGSSSNACSDTYHGAYAWSAPEMSAFKAYISGLTRLKAYVNFHSYAESWLNPYGYTAAKPADYTVQEANGKNTTAAIKAVNGQTYAYGPAYTTIYPASGVPSDWVYDSLKVKLSQAVELRGNSFQPSPTLIQPIGAELTAGILTLATDTTYV